MPERNTRPFIGPILAVALGLLAIGFQVGYSSGLNAPRDSRLEMMHILRNDVIATCKAHPELIEEANGLLPDNNDGRITPADIRKVVIDVVSRC